MNDDDDTQDYATKALWYEAETVLYHSNTFNNVPETYYGNLSR